MPDPTKKGKKEIKGTKKKLLVPKEAKKKMRLMTDEDFAEKKMLKVKEKLKPKSLTDKTSEFPIDMNSPFKMAYQNRGGAPALMKALVGDQNKLPENLKKAIKAAPGDSPVTKKGRYKVSSDGKTYRDRTGEKGIGANKRYNVGEGPMAKEKK